MNAAPGVDQGNLAVFHPVEVHQPRQIYASAADRRTGRRWSRRSHRPFWVPAALVAGATMVALEVLRSFG